MTRSRIAMVAAAAGLLLLGLLAAALFTPRDDDADNTEQGEADEIAKLDVSPKVKENLAESLGYPVARTPATPKEEVKPKTETPPVKPEPKETKPEAPKAEGGVIEYTIQSGDMISKLAARYGCTSEAIYALNEGLDKSNAHKIRVGQKIRIPVGEKGAEAAASAAQPKKEETAWWPERIITAEAGDTAFSLAVEHYGAKSFFRLIVNANPDLAWADRLKGGEKVKLPAWGEQPETVKTNGSGGETVERSGSEGGGIIPPRK